ncbi:MAG: glycine cleavage system protein GcvH [candidate division Zixibacteria bacterium]|nr:glycine cleavage system protein GcvH [candidate division Zixibacteria bacterium]
MNIPSDLRYTEEHEWVKIEGQVARIGITDYAQGELGDIVFVELPSAGDTVEKMKEFGTIEAVKAVSEIYSPLSGKVVEINAALEDDPMIVNRDPYGEGWIIKIEMSDPSEVNQLLNAADYGDLIGS